MNLLIFISFRAWYVASLFISLFVAATGLNEKKGVHSNLIYDCVGLSASQTEMCSKVELNDDFITNDVYCRVEDCRMSCCSTVKHCFNANYFTHSRVNCIQKKMNKEFGTCCKLVVKKFDKTKIVYLSGGLGVAVISIGIFVLASSRSNSSETYESSDIEDQDSLNPPEDSSPHMDVKQLVATDGNDVFWQG